MPMTPLLAVTVGAAGVALLLLAIGLHRYYRSARRPTDYSLVAAKWLYVAAVVTLLSAGTIVLSVLTTFGASIA